MTPKDKAQELIKYYAGFISPFPIFKLTYLRPKELSKAKACAIRCVDEIINSLPTSPPQAKYYETLQDHIDDAVDYWKKVKEEINKL